MKSKQSCVAVCKGYLAIGLEACLGCAGMSNLEKMALSITRINGVNLNADGRCKHNMLPGQCGLCAGMKMTPVAASVGLAFIR